MTIVERRVSALVERGISGFSGLVSHDVLCVRQKSCGGDGIPAGVLL